MSARAWTGAVVIASGSTWDGPSMSEKLLALELSQWAPILFVDPPRSALRMLTDRSGRAKLRARRLEIVAPGVARLVTFGPPGLTRPGMRRVNAWWLRRSIRRALRRLDAQVHALIVASLEDLFGCCDEYESVLYGTDDFTAGAELMGLSRSWLVQQEARQVGRADLITSVSEPLAQRWRELGRDVTVIPNGCNAGLYARTDEFPDPEDVTLPGPIAGFVGHLSHRIDLACLESVADTGASLLLVGPRQSTFAIDRIGSLLERPNVQWVGPKSSSELPSYLKVMTVGLTPYADSAFNRASYPLKTLEYLAAGRPAISTDLPSARTLPARFVDIAHDSTQFGDAAARLLNLPRDESHVEAMQAYARTQSWSARASEFAKLMGIADAPDAQADPPTDSMHG